MADPMGGHARALKPASQISLAVAGRRHAHQDAPRRAQPALVSRPRGRRRDARNVLSQLRSEVGEGQISDALGERVQGLGGLLSEGREACAERRVSEGRRENRFGGAGRRVDT